MKRTFFVLALLVSAFASAVVQVAMEVAPNDETARKTLLFSEIGAKQLIIPEVCGVTIEMALMHEAAESATFTLSVKEGDKDVCSPKITLTYGQEKTFECPAEDIVASLKMTASQVIEKKAE
ncbi:MAG TPA: hypothetical protein VI521_02750 [Candidatus Babeliales bacterium]|nr:hypothetical protein [Candidatus Babeliales bacterium]